MNRHDAALRAVLRVREAKEQEALLGLVHALGEQDKRERTARDTRGILDRVRHEPVTSGPQFSALQTALSCTGDQIVIADREVETSRAVTGQARAGLANAAQRTRMVRMLLERRELARAAEQRRADAKELDEFAQAGWLRRRQS